MMKLNRKRKRILPRFAAWCTVLGLLVTGLGAGLLPAAAADVPEQKNTLPLTCKSAVLMEVSTGTVLYADHEHTALPPASVTKIMTLLLVMEAIDSGALRMEDPITASAYASSMGGSQIYLKEGETMSARDMIKSVVIASANDAAVALAEHIAGSETAFVERMNQRAAELGMEDTHFENTNGLDDTAENHVTSAVDIAKMSRALIAHKEILTFSSTWMDSIRNGAFGLTNTNRLVRYYRGCNGLKTGSTHKAGFCISATAERDGMTLIAVIMGADTRDHRNASAAALLDWGFARYGLFTADETALPDLSVTGGVKSTVACRQSAFSCILPKADIPAVKAEMQCPPSVKAPVQAQESVGKTVFSVNGKVIGETPVLAAESVDRIGFFELWKRMLAHFLIA